MEYTRATDLAEKIDELQAENDHLQALVDEAQKIIPWLAYPVDENEPDNATLVTRVPVHRARAAAAWLERAGAVTAVTPPMEDKI